MNKDKILRRLKEYETSRDILLRQLSTITNKIDEYRKMFEWCEEHDGDDEC